MRRVLANIPTYMMFDDHDFTDDWNLNPMWYDRVYTTDLGVTSARNALASYAVFQDWGNDPIRYEKQDDYKELLARITQLFPTGEPGPVADAANRLDALFGFKEQVVSDPVTGRVPGAQSDHQVALLRAGAEASRRRDRQSHAPQLPVAPRSAGQRRGQFRSERSHGADGADSRRSVHGRQGSAARDRAAAGDRSAAARRAGRARGVPRLRRDGRTRAKLDPNLKFGSRGMSGTNPDAIEAWAFDPFTLEAFLQRLKPYGKVVLLSGDVHYSASTVMSYFTKGEADPARFVQFTSSGFKNVMPSYITVIDRSLALAHLIVRQPLGAERMGWLRRPSNPIVLDAGTTESGHSARVSREAQAGADAAADARLARRHDHQSGAASGLVVASRSRSSTCARTTSVRADPAVQVRRRVRCASRAD